MKVTKDQKTYIGRDLDSMSSATNYYKWIISEFGKYIGDNVAEVGAGSGTFSKSILKKGVKNFWAIEPSPEMYPLLKENLKGIKDVRLHNGFFEEIAKNLKGKLDTVFYINVMEHVQYDLEELKTVYKTLKPGGHICIYVPAMQSIYGTFDEQVGHYRRYTKKDLRSKLEEAGFEVNMLHYSDMVGILPWWLSFKVLKRKDLGAKQVALYDKVVIPVIKFQESIVKSPIGKNIWAVGTKPA